MLSPVPQVIMQEVIDIPEVKQRWVSTGMQTSRKTDQTVEVARVIPHERMLKPAGERALVRERVRQFEMNGGVSCSSTVEVPRVNPGDRQREDPEDGAPRKSRKQERDPDPRAPCALLPLRRLWMTLTELETKIQRWMIRAELETSIWTTFCWR